MVSLDDPERNKAFAESLEADLVLLSDSDKEVADAYGVLALGGLYARRWTYYIDPDGIIRDIDKDVRVGSAGQDIAARLETLGFPTKPKAEAPAAPQITMGNGDANWIVTEGATRDGATFTFPEVKIAANGWLVMHPFENGKPRGEIYVGATFVAAGTSKDVEITVDPAPASGDMFIVMLHSDVNDDRNFDFVFVDERNVLDKAVFEGTTMIAHPFAAP